MTNDPNGRFVAVDSARLRPGVCLICNGITGPFILTKRFDPRINGNVYLCKGCLTDMALILDLVPNVNELAVAEARQAMQAEFDAKEKESFDVVIDRFLPHLVSRSDIIFTLGVADEEDSDGAPEADAGAVSESPETDARNDRDVSGDSRDADVAHDVSDDGEVEDGSTNDEGHFQVFGTSLD